MPRNRNKPDTYMFDMSTFDDEQLAGVSAIKEHYDTAMAEGVHPDMMLDMKRLRFGRWLAEHRLVNEFSVEAPTEDA